MEVCLYSQMLVLVTICVKEKKQKAVLIIIITSMYHKIVLFACIVYVCEAYYLAWTSASVFIVTE